MNNDHHRVELDVLDWNNRYFEGHIFIESFTSRMAGELKPNSVSVRLGFGKYAPRLVRQPQVVLNSNR
jgi:hypothetical protein